MSGVRPAARAVWLVWLPAWLGLMVLAVANGALRVTVTEPMLGEVAARALATAILLAATTVYVWWVLRLRPLPGPRTAWAIGVVWMVLTLAFESGWGRLVAGSSWVEMVADYDVTAGRTWLLVPVWVACAPAAIRRLQAERDQERSAR